MTPDLERWLPVVGYEDLYAVSDHGRVKSFHRRGRWDTGPGGRVLAHGVLPKGYHVVHLYRNGKQKVRTVHALMAEAFIGPCPEGMEVRHLDGDPSRNVLSNICYGSHSENEQDKFRHGTRSRDGVEECPHGHRMTPDNTYTGRKPDGSTYRYCRACHLARGKEHYRARKARNAA